MTRRAHCSSFPANLTDLDKDLGVQLLKIKAYDQLKDYPQIEALLRKLSELYPQQAGFRKQLVKFYLDQHRPQDAEKELRAIVAADPKNVEAESELVRFLYSVKGARRSEGRACRAHRCRRRYFSLSARIG